MRVRDFKIEGMGKQKRSEHFFIGGALTYLSKCLN